MAISNGSPGREVAPAGGRHVPERFGGACAAFPTAMANPATRISSRKAAWRFMNSLRFRTRFHANRARDSLNHQHGDTEVRGHGEEVLGFQKTSSVPPYLRNS